MATWEGIHPTIKAYGQYLFRIADYYQLNPRLTSGFRSFAKQDQLYQRYLRGEHNLPVAPPGRSYHNYGRAFDMVSDNNAWLGQIWRSWGGIWGGEKDPVHFQA